MEKKIHEEQDGFSDSLNPGVVQWEIYGGYVTKINQDFEKLSFLQARVFLKFVWFLITQNHLEVLINLPLALQLFPSPGS